LIANGKKRKRSNDIWKISKEVSEELKQSTLFDSKLEKTLCNNDFNQINYTNRHRNTNSFNNLTENENFQQIRKNDDVFKEIENQKKKEFEFENQLDTLLQSDKNQILNGFNRELNIKPITKNANDRHMDLNQLFLNGKINISLDNSNKAGNNNSNEIAQFLNQNPFKRARTNLFQS
jgi:hypothetical protein